MIPRRVSKQLKIGDVTIGGGAPIRVQSMTTAFTRDVEATVAEILRLAEAGCEIVRVAVPHKEDADALTGNSQALADSGDCRHSL